MEFKKDYYEKAFALPEVIEPHTYFFSFLSALF